MQDLTIELGEQTLNCRTAGIIVKDNHILLHKNKKDSFWTLIGGRIQLGEDSAQAVKREFEEELGITVEAKRLLWTVENFFTYKSRLYHEFSFIYLLHDVEDKVAEVVSSQAETFQYEWIPFEKMKELTLKPAFLQKKLLHLPAAPEHLIYKES
jgi:8-oxo-dGTP pyrophosphatase MutT (NUDIX family)